MLQLMQEAKTSQEPAKDGAELKARLLARVEAAIDEKLATMAEGQGLGIVFRLEVIIPERDRQWAEAVKARDGYKCRECGETQDVQAHHVLSVGDYPALMNDLDNGITLCPACHALKHPGLEKVILWQAAKPF